MVFKKRKAENCGVGQTTCVQKEIDFKIKPKGTTLHNVTENECKAWSDMKGLKWTSTGSWPNDPTGCISDDKKFGLIQEKLVMVVAIEVINVSNDK